MITNREQLEAALGWYTKPVHEITKEELLILISYYTYAASDLPIHKFWFNIFKSRLQIVSQ